MAEGRWIWSDIRSARGWGGGYIGFDVDRQPQVSLDNSAEVTFITSLFDWFSPTVQLPTIMLQPDVAPV